MKRGMGQGARRAMPWPHNRKKAMRTSREQSFEAQDLLELALAGAVDLSSLEHDELVELACLALERLTGARRPWKAASRALTKRSR